MHLSNSSFHQCSQKYPNFGALNSSNISALLNTYIAHSHLQNEPSSCTIHCLHFDEIKPAAHIHSTYRECTAIVKHSTRGPYNGQLTTNAEKMPIVTKKSPGLYLLKKCGSSCQLLLVSKPSLYSTLADAQMNNLFIQNRINIKCRQLKVTTNLTTNAPSKDNY